MSRYSRSNTNQSSATDYPSIKQIVKPISDENSLYHSSKDDTINKLLFDLKGNGKNTEQSSQKTSSNVSQFQTHSRRDSRYLTQCYNTESQHFHRDFDAKTVKTTGYIPKGRRFNHQPRESWRKVDERFKDFSKEYFLKENKEKTKGDKYKLGSAKKMARFRSINTPQKYKREFSDLRTKVKNKLEEGASYAQNEEKTQKKLNSSKKLARYGSQQLTELEDQFEALSLTVRNFREELNRKDKDLEDWRNKTHKLGSEIKDVRSEADGIVLRLDEERRKIEKAERRFRDLKSDIQKTERKCDDARERSDLKKDVDVRSVSRYRYRSSLLDQTVGDE
jgi:uncharacterized coiled-coil DUF342 family protein